jgi:hypothetical protein
MGASTGGVQSGCFLHVQAKFPKEVRASNGNLHKYCMLLSASLVKIFGNILLVRSKAGAEAAGRVQAVFTGDDVLSSGDYRCGVYLVITACADVTALFVYM